MDNQQHLLEEMGFPKDAALKALVKTKGNLEEALALLVSSSIINETPKKKEQDNDEDDVVIVGISIGDKVEMKRSNGTWIVAEVIQVIDDGYIMLEYTSPDGKTFQKKLAKSSPLIAKMGTHLFDCCLGDLVEVCHKGKWIVARVTDSNSRNIILQFYKDETSIVQLMVQRNSGLIEKLGTHTNIKDEQGIEQLRGASRVSIPSPPSSPPPLPPPDFEESVLEDVKKQFGSEKEENLLSIGSVLDIRDSMGRWYEAEIVDIKAPDQILIHYLKFSSRWNEWLSFSTNCDRIAPFQTFSCGNIQVVL
jgi:hypothetical protein